MKPLNITAMYKKILFTIMLTFGISSFSQVGIGTTTPEATLDIRSSSITTPTNTDGLLIPKINVFPAVNPTALQQSMMVYLTTTVGSNPPGFYYWNNPTTSWLPFTSSTASFWDRDASGYLFPLNTNDRVEIVNNSTATGTPNTGGLEMDNRLRLDRYGLTSNTGTQLYMQYGNDGDFSVDTNSLFVDASANSVGIGTTIPDARLEIYNTTGTVNNLHIQKTNGAADAVFIENVGSGAAMRAQNSTANYWAELGTPAYAGYFNGRVEMPFSTDATGTAGSGVLEIGNSLRLDGNEIITNMNTTLYVNGDNNGDVNMDGTTFLLDASTNRLGIGTYTPSSKLDVYNGGAGVALTSRSTGGLGGLFRGGNVDPLAGWFYGDSNFAGYEGLRAGGQGVGVLGVAQLDTDAATDHTGGLFVVRNIPASGARAFSMVGTDLNNTVYKIIGYGTVSTIVKDIEGSPRIMHAPETPEALFQDYGVGQLINGKATIAIDPIFAKNIVVDEQHPLRVFIQLKGDCNGTYVTNESTTSFEVRELQQGTSNVKFTWSITANRKDEMLGGAISKYQDLRFEPLKNHKYDAQYVKPSNYDEMNDVQEAPIEPEVQPEIKIDYVKKERIEPANDRDQPSATGQQVNSNDKLFIKNI